MQKSLSLLFAIMILTTSCELMEIDTTLPCDTQGTTLCDGVCTNITESPNCGACGVVCESPSKCEIRNGVYQCVSEQCELPNIVSEGKCILPNTAEHCGSKGEPCVNGVCVPKNSDDRLYYCKLSCRPPEVPTEDGKCVIPNTAEYCGHLALPCPPSRGECIEDANGSYYCKTACIKPYVATRSGDCVIPGTAEYCGDDALPCPPKRGKCEVKADDPLSYYCKSKCKAPEILTPNYDCVVPNNAEYCGDDALPCPAETSDCVAVSENRWACQHRCENGKRDEGESGIDCGGACKPCQSCSFGIKAVPCPEGQFCDSAIGYRCNVKCTPDNGVFNTESKDCPGEDRICRADGRCSSKYFITEWQTTADNQSIQLLNNGRKNDCDFEVDWGDGEKGRYTDCVGEHLRHSYQKAGSYRVKISGKYDGWGWPENWYGINDSDSTRKTLMKHFKGVISFGPVGLGERAFSYFPDFQVPEYDIPDASKMSTASHMFYHSRMNHPIGHWDLSNVTNTKGMFSVAADFNQPIGQWNLSKVTTMEWMFERAKLFNQPIGEWDVSKVTTMRGLFSSASAFNQPIERWKVFNVTNMQQMFSHASAFNQYIGGWDVSKVTNMQQMFFHASVFNKPIARWKVSRVTDMAKMFSYASAFNQAIEGWDVSKVSNMQQMFCEAKRFNQDLSKWNINGIFGTRASDIFKNSGLSRDNYCRMTNNFSTWGSISHTLGLSYKCR